MKEQKYIIKNAKSFEPRHIFECGQCFRWNANEDESYTGVIGKNVLNVKKENQNIIITGMCETDLEELCIEYFDLERNYEEIKENLSLIDNNLKNSIEYGSGIRILNQNLWETLISFIISANNNIPRIKKIIEKISKEYGKEIKWNQNTYYTFPTVEELSKATQEGLRECGMGFRDKYIFNVTKMVKNKEINLEEITNIQDTNKIRETLMRFPGVGEKVADCVLLFSNLKRFDVFPVDVWVRRVMNELYIKNEDETKVDKKQIQKLAEEKYKNLKGIAQQYLFYWKREA